MKKFLRLAVVAGLIAAGGIASVATPAHAASDGSNGLDCKPDFIVGGGSDTTQAVMQQLGDAYTNLSGGDLVGSPNFQVTTAPCTTPVATTVAPTGSPILNTPGNYYGNFDKDAVGQATAFGSGAGLSSVCSTATGGPFTYGTLSIGFARSSKDPSAAQLVNCAVWSFAQDGVVFTTYGRTVPNLTKAQITGIYNGTITDWSAIAGQAAGAIQVWGLNAASGTGGTAATYLGLTSVNAATTGGCTTGCGVGRPLVGSGTCAAPTGAFPFENDHRNIILDPCFDPVNAVWFGSNGEYLTFAYKRGGTAANNVFYNAQRINLDGKAPSAGNILLQTYQPTRYLNHVTNKADASCAATGTVCNAFPDAATTDFPVIGASSGPGGAVREFTRALCRPTSTVAGGANPFDSPAGNSSGALSTQTTVFSDIIASNNFYGVKPGVAPNSRCRVIVG